MKELRIVPDTESLSHVRRVKRAMFWHRGAGRSGASG